MQKLVKIFVNSLYGENNRNDFTEECNSKSEHWMSTEYDERVLEHWKLPTRDYIKKLKQNDGLESETNLKNTMPAHLGSYILSISKRINSNFLREIDGLKMNNVFHTNTDSLYIEREHWDGLDKIILGGEDLRQRKDDYKKVVSFYKLFLAPKIKLSLTMEE